MFYHFSLRHSCDVFCHNRTYNYWLDYWLQLTEPQSIASSQNRQKLRHIERHYFLSVSNMNCCFFPYDIKSNYLDGKKCMHIPNFRCNPSLNINNKKKHHTCANEVAGIDWCIHYQTSRGIYTIELLLLHTSYRPWHALVLMPLKC